MDPTEEAGASNAPPVKVEPGVSMKNKKCIVCGDKALGYNFNALTCESCKAFFRRNALKDKQFKCPFSDNCEVTVVTRRFCQKCRLKKCFDIGMKKEWILSDVEKQQKRAKIEENRAKKRLDPTDSGASMQAESSSLLLPPASPAESIASTASERPQAIVLPSARLQGAEEGPSRTKLMRYDLVDSSPSTPLPLAAAPEAHSAPENSTANQHPPNLLHPQRKQARIVAASESAVSLIKQELTSSEEEAAVLGQSDPMRTDVLQEQVVETEVATTYGVQPNYGGQFHPVILEVRSALPEASVPSQPVASNYEEVVPGPSGHAITLPSTSTIQSDPIDLGLHSTSHPHLHPLHQPIQPNGDIGGVGASTPPPPLPPPSSIGNNSMMIPDFSHTNIDNLDDIVAVAIEAEFHSSNMANLGADDNGAGGGNGGEDGRADHGGSQMPQEGYRPKSDATKLKAEEKAKLEELFIASRALVEPLDLETSPFSSEPNNLISVINLTDLAIKRIIRMTKKISPFLSMCQEDQIALLKGGVTELMILRSVMNYNPEKNAWRLPTKEGGQKELSMECLKQASALGVNLYEEHQKFVRSFDPRWRTDENVMLLLSAISLFQSTRSNVIHKDVIKLEQDGYYYLLRRYLESVCEHGCEARRVYLHLIACLKDLQKLNESHIQLFLEVNPKLVEPLLIEIFDLNPMK